MFRNYLFPVPALLALALVSCSGSTDSSSDYRPTATIKDIMDSVIDPSADEIWESVATVVDANGIRDLFPETDDEWAEVRRSAIRVVEGTNLLLMPGRRVAAPGVVSENPDIELNPEDIQALIDGDREKFVELAHGLHDVAIQSLSAIEAHDTDALLQAGALLDLACERCHLNYWYPNDEGARALFEENERALRETIEGGVQ
jgi:hypothetical protein